MSRRRTRRPRRTDDRCTHLTNRDRMGTDGHAARRRIMRTVYAARDALRGHGVDLPRVTVRVCDAHPEVLGVARVGACIIWISATALDAGDDVLAWTVLHEMGHAILGLGHDRACPLMRPTLPARVDVATARAVFTRAAVRDLGAVSS